MTKVGFFCCFHSLVTWAFYGSSRYGPWMDTNLVLPLGPRKCQVIFDYFIEADLKVFSRFVHFCIMRYQRCWTS